MDLSYQEIQEIYGLAPSQIKQVEKKSKRKITDAVDIVMLADGVAILYDVAELDLEEELQMSVLEATCEDVDELGNQNRFTIPIDISDEFETPEDDF